MPFKLPWLRRRRNREVVAAYYFRPGGVDRYLRPDGTSFYLRPQI